MLDLHFSLPLISYVGMTVIKYVYTAHNFVSKEPPATVIRPILRDLVAERFACFQQRSRDLEATNLKMIAA
jgi:hypothetical protein